MTLDWLPRDNELKDHDVGGDAYWGQRDCPLHRLREEAPARAGRTRGTGPLHRLGHAQQPQTVQLLSTSSSTASSWPRAARSTSHSSRRSSPGR